jgi:hypothetical protein
MTDYPNFLGRLYDRVTDYFYNGSVTSAMSGLGSFTSEGKEFSVKPNNFSVWNKTIGEQHFTKKPDIQKADVPEVTIEMTETMDIAFGKFPNSCSSLMQVNFSIELATGKRTLTNATPFMSHIRRLINNLIYSNELCSWDIGQPYYQNYIARTNDGTIAMDSRIRKSQDGFTDECRFAIYIVCSRSFPEITNTP